MRVPYKEPEQIHVPAPLSPRMQKQLDRKFWAARKQYWESRPQQYWPEEFKQWHQANQLKAVTP